jgi:hypothetical protein
MLSIGVTDDRESFILGTRSLSTELAVFCSWPYWFFILYNGTHRKAHADFRNEQKN